MTCPACGAQDVSLDGVDGVLLCEDCLADPLMPAKSWKVDPGFRTLFTAEFCEQCATTVCIPDEGLMTGDGLILCWGCSQDGMPAQMYHRRMQERTTLSPQGPERKTVWAVVEHKPNETGDRFVRHMVVAEWASFEAAERDRRQWMQANPTLHYTITTCEGP